jgi:multiple sugar transport system substrate-binding protein
MFLCVAFLLFQETVRAADKVELVFWDMVWGPPEYVETGKKLVEKFNESQDAIHVTYESKAWTNWYQTFITAASTGTNPDLSTTAAFLPWQLYTLGATMPIDDVIEQWKAEGKLEDFVPGTIESMKWEGHYIGAPFGIDLRVLYVRTDQMEEMGLTEFPKNWEEFREFAKKLTGEGVYGLGVANDYMGWQTLSALMLNNGGGFFANKDGKPVSGMFADRTVEAAQLLADMVADGSVDPAGPGLEKSDVTRLFGQGKMAMTFQSSGWENNFPDQKDKIAVAPMIVSPNGTKGTFGATNPLMIFSNTKHPEEAKVFLKWWVENNLELWTEGHQTQVPTLISFQQNPYFQNDPFAKVVAEEWAPYAKNISANFGSTFPQLNEIEGEGVLFTMIQEILQGKEVQGVLQKVEDRFSEILSQ